MPRVTAVVIIPPEHTRDKVTTGNLPVALSEHSPAMAERLCLKNESPPNRINIRDLGNLSSLTRKFPFETHFRSGSLVHLSAGRQFAAQKDFGDNSNKSLIDKA